MSGSLGIVGCGSAKLPRPARARDLYCGTYFRLRLRCALEENDRVLILSAKYGLIHPREHVAPYSLRITDLTPRERTDLVLRVGESLSSLDWGTLRVYAGIDYRAILDELGASYETSVRGPDT